MIRTVTRTNVHVLSAFGFATRIIVDDVVMHFVRVSRSRARRCCLGRDTTLLLLLLLLQRSAGLCALRFARFILAGLQCTAADGRRIVLTDLRTDMILCRR